MKHLFNLNWIHQLIKLDLAYYLHGSFWLTLLNFAALISNFGLSVLFARVAKATLYGQYKFVVSVFGVLSLFTLPGMNLAIAQAVARGNRAAFIVGTYEKFKFSWITSLPLSGLAVYFLFRSKNVSLGWAFLFSAFFFPFAYGFANDAYLEALQRFRESSLFGLVRDGLRVVMVGMAVVLTRNITVITLAYLVAFSAVNLAIYQWLRQDISTEFGLDDPKSIIRYGRHLTLIQSMATFAQYLDHLLLTYLFGFTELAIYAVAWAFPEAMKSLFKQIATLAFPRLTNTPQAQVWAKIQAKAFPLLLLGGGIAAGLIMSLPNLIPLVYTKRYSDSIAPAQLLSLSLVVYPLIQVLRSALLGHKQVKNLYMFHIVYMAARIISLIIFVPFYGVLGAALGVLLARIAVTVYLWKAVKTMSFSD